MSEYHISVLFDEVIQSLRVKKGARYVDATLGGGGHTGGILSQGGNVLGIDADEDSIRFVSSKYERNITDGSLQVVQGNFKDLDDLAQKNGFSEVDGVLFDLGVSSHQFDTGGRGFSFQKEAALDMRMDRTLSVKAKDLINGLTKKELEELFLKLGEERFARRIAEAIVKKREEKLFETTTELAELIIASVPRMAHTIHPATRVFQALRIAVNDELHVLKDALPQALGLLSSGGRIVVISFHSLEDRIVKETFKLFETEGEGSIVTQKPIIASDEEQHMNPRSRSAKLRVFEKK